LPDKIRALHLHPVGKKGGGRSLK